ncbi:MAG: aminotransferase class III-fold pyridoxal phosphate-dependent enzyme [Actinomycetales bacterium]|nr:aminotransferase class III-fold pyridoxal phosphate-dependent enzyme [Candidatus Lutibacillus vidarii]
MDPETVRVSDGAPSGSWPHGCATGVVSSSGTSGSPGLARCGFTGLVEGLGVQADLVVHGEALGGGVFRLGAVAGRGDVLGLAADIAPTGLLRDPLASAVGLETVAMLGTGEYQRRATTLAALLRSLLHPLVGEGLTAVRVAGLWAGLDVAPERATAGDIASRLKCYGVLVSPPVGQLSGLGTTTGDVGRHYPTGRRGTAKGPPGRSGQWSGPRAGCWTDSQLNG